MYIHGDQSRKNILCSANLRSLVNAYKSGYSNIRVKGSRIMPVEINNRGDAPINNDREINNDRSCIQTETDLSK